MHTLTTAAIIASSLLLAACEHTPARLMAAPSQPVTQVASAETAGAKPTVVCTREVPTGMRMAMTLCRQAGAIEERRNDDRSWAEKIPAELPSER